MAPEIIAKRKYGLAADWWSLGCVAYDMLKGDPPFRNAYVIPPSQSLRTIEYVQTYLYMFTFRHKYLYMYTFTCKYIFFYQYWDENRI